MVDRGRGLRPALSKEVVCLTPGIQTFMAVGEHSTINPKKGVKDHSRVLTKLDTTIFVTAAEQVFLKSPVWT